ncbi:MAG: site-specific DNA-methyltransferase [Cytophagales bacterium]|nr:site-specific DNA-methyltransferase [Cytophagales bacterium]
MTINLYYQDEFVQLYNGDCFDILPTIEEKVDMVFCDPPYGNLVRCAWDSQNIDLSLLWLELHRLGYKNTAYVFTGAQPFTSKLVASNYKEFKQELIWRKTQGTGHLNCKRMALKNHENILIFYNKQPVYNPQMTAGEPYLTKKNCQSNTYGQSKPTATNNTTGYRYPLSVLDFKYDSKRYHPTQKPVALCEYMLKTYTNTGMLVLDPFAGSGSSLVAAKQNKRRAIGIELDTNYCDIIVKRLQHAG